MADGQAFNYFIFIYMLFYPRYKLTAGAGACRENLTLKGLVGIRTIKLCILLIHKWLVYDL